LESGYEKVGGKKEDRKKGQIPFIQFADTQQRGTQNKDAKSVGGTRDERDNVIVINHKNTKTSNIFIKRY